MGEFYVDYREVELADDGVAGNLTAQGANTPGNFIVPKGAQYITAVRIAVGAISADVITGNTTSVHLIGLTGQQWYAGPCLSISGAAATAGAFGYSASETYQTRIPVANVSQFSAEAVFNGDDPGSVHIGLTIEFDGVPGMITDADTREIAIGAAANTLVAMQTRGADTAAGNIQTNGKPLREIRFGAALDPEGNATAGLIWMPALHLDGNGLVSANKPLRLIGTSGTVGPDTDVTPAIQVVNLQRTVCGPAGVKTQTGTIEASAQNIESINPGQAIVCLCFG